MTDGSLRVVEPDGASRRVLDPAETVDLLGVDGPSAGWVQELSEELTGDLSSQIDIAMAIQGYLRGSEFSYSLTLADPVLGPEGEPLDPVSHFLETKQGYCTQFATAMVMLARAQDIPARMAVGFLPGSQGLDGTRTVVASDAHAWPELFINGLGWTRFEPTPASRAGTAPLYPTTPSDEEVPTAAEDPTVAEPLPEAEVPDSGGIPGSQGGPGWFERNAAALAQAALGLAAAALLASVVPLAARWHRRQLRRHGPAHASEDTAEVEGQWAVLLTTLADLGVRTDPAATPRTLQEHYTREIAPDPPTREALARATDRLEAARYTAEPPQPGAMAQDVQRVVEWARAHAGRGARLRAALLPDSGLAQLRSLRPGGRQGMSEPVAARPGG